MKHNITRIAIALFLSLIVITSVSADRTYAADETENAAEITVVSSDSTNAVDETENATKVPVLTYHAVGPHDSGKLQVSKYKFKKQVDWIKKCGYKTLTMEEFVEWYEGKRTIPRITVSGRESWTAIKKWIKK